MKDAGEFLCASLELIKFLIPLLAKVKTDSRKERCDFPKVSQTDGGLFLLNLTDFYFAVCYLGRHLLKCFLLGHYRTGME